MAKALRPYGFREVKPPSTLLPPGTIVRKVGSASVLVCKANESLGEAVTPDTSKSVDVTLSDKLQEELTVALPEIESFKADVGVKVVRDVTASITDVTLLMLSDATVAANVSNRDQSCASVLKGLLVDGTTPVWMIQAVLQGDVSYTVHFEASVDAEVQATLTKALAAKLGEKYASVSETTVKGNDLYFGVVGSRRLGAMGTLPDSDLPKRAAASDVEKCIGGDVESCDLSDDAVIAPPISTGNGQ